MNYHLTIKPVSMFVLKFNSFDFENHLPDLAESVSTHHYGKKIVIKDSIATGFYKVLNFPNELKAVITNYVLNTDFSGEREQVMEDYYMLHINQVKAGSEFSVMINDKEVNFDDKIYTAVFLTDSKEPFGLKGTKGACFSQLKIIIPKNWLKKNMGDICNDELLEKYFNLKEQRLFFDSFDESYHTLVDKVMNTEDTIYYLAVTQSFVTVITERFFCKMSNKLSNRSTDLQFLDRVA
jgi:hypothetical protein